MMIEVTEKEKTALSLLLGLRQKFALAKKENESYSANELHKMLSESLTKINNNEMRFIETLINTTPKQKEEDTVWGEIDRQIERSTIKRYPWKKILGNSLTEEIIRIRNNGDDVKDAYDYLKKDIRVKKFLDSNKREKKKILQNLKISIHARYGENQTAEKIMREELEE